MRQRGVSVFVFQRLSLLFDADNNPRVLGKQKLQDKCVTLREINIHSYVCIRNVPNPMNVFAVSVVAASKCVVVKLNLLYSKVEC